MSAKDNVTELPAIPQRIVEFSRPYTFEGKEYTVLDLSGLENLTSQDLFNASKIFSTEDYISPRPEADPKYCCLLASIACGMPREFFNGLPLRDGMKVRDCVFNFFKARPCWYRLQNAAKINRSTFYRHIHRH